MQANDATFEKLFIQIDFVVLHFTFTCKLYNYNGEVKRREILLLN